MHVKILRHFATTPELDELRQWILGLRAADVLKPNKMGPGRYYVPLGATTNQPAAIARIDRDLQAAFGITGQCVPLSDMANVQRTGATPSFVGMQTAGGFVHPHTDGNIGDELQFRCTLLVNKPERGGKLVLANEEHEMDEGDIYCFVSNNTMHGTTAVKGATPRMACSLGFIVAPSFQLMQG